MRIETLNLKVTVPVPVPDDKGLFGGGSFGKVGPGIYKGQIQAVKRQYI